MLTTVVIVLLLTSRAAPYTFTGGTEGASFTCHCSPDVQCDDETGACPGDVCGVTGLFPWGSLACQIGNIALWLGRADQSGGSSHRAERCIDGNTNSATIQRSCCNPWRTSGELTWSINLRGTFAIGDVTIYPTAGNVRETIRGVEVYVSDNRTPTDAELCGVQSGTIQTSTTVPCAQMVGRYVTIRQPDVSIEQMVFCEVQVQGFEYYPCGVYGGDYRYGPGCVQICHCEHQCDANTGDCNGDCTSGYWGVTCAADCNCDSHNRMCDSVTGACDADCDSGYSGFNCQTECDDRHWGSNCVHECWCDCDSITGECDGLCDPGNYGNNCEHECRDGTWGIGNESGCLNSCYCNVPCDRINGRCEGPCAAGRHGNSCQYVCVDGAWGEDCENTCNCYADEVCEKTDGSCDRCPDWVVGVRCDQELPRMADITPVLSRLNNNVTLRFPALHNADYYTVEYRTDGDWMMDAIRYPHNTQQNQQMIHITVEYNIEYHIKIVPWKDDIDQPGEPSQVLDVFVSCDRTAGFWGEHCEHSCKCLDVSEVCNATNGHCESGCDDRYIGEGCNVVKPSLRESTVTFTEGNDVITATISDIEYRTELVSEYLVQYKLIHEDTFISINVNPISGQRRREVGADDVVLQIPFSDQSINAQYQFRITPLISSPEYNGVFGVPSDITLYNSGCLQYSGLPSCNHWCVCRDDPGTLCLLTCDYCYTCDSEPELPSEENVNFEISDFTTNSIRIQFIDAHPDLPYIPLFLTRLGDHHANISSWVSNTEYTYNSLTPNTDYVIDITAVLEEGVLSKSWALTATTLTESSDNTLPIVIGCVVFVTGVVALLVVIGIILKRHKARPSREEAPQEQQSVHPYDYIDERNVRNSTQISDNRQIVPVVTPSVGYSGLVVTPGGCEQSEARTRGNRHVYVNENAGYTNIEEAAE